MGKLREHHYQSEVVWTGNQGTGTSGYAAYSRNHEVRLAGKAEPLAMSSDAAFRGDPARYTPEELLLISLSSCHMLWFLHLCSDAGIAVSAYVDKAVATMRENPDGSGEFTGVTLRPEVTVSDPSRRSELAALHHKAHEMCFIARSVNFPVDVESW